MISLQQVRAQAHREANRVLASSPGTIPVDVEAIAKSLKIKIVRQRLEDEISGFLLIRENGVTIAVNSSHHLNRRRFTIAHELGHFLMHRSEAGFFIDASPVFFRGSASTAGLREQEQAANAFAAALLMPEGKIRDEIETEPIDVLDEDALRIMADRYKVSSQALSIRLYELDLLVYSPPT